MKLDDRCVFDTNVVVSAFLFPASKPGVVFHKTLEGKKWITSTEVVDELARVLSSPKFDRYVGLPVREAFVDRITREAEFIQPSESIRVCRDPNDDKFLELAVAGSATCIVTGDEDLLALHPFRGIPILTPTQFLESLAR